MNVMYPKEIAGEARDIKWITITPVSNGFQMSITYEEDYTNREQRVYTNLASLQAAIRDLTRDECRPMDGDEC
jgi:hypothetical protein